MFTVLIRFIRDENERDMHIPVIVNPLEEEGEPWDDDNVGIGKGYVDWWMQQWASQVAEERTRVGLDEEDVLLIGEEEATLGDEEGGDGGVAADV
ncbi:hypothetical protein KI387_028480, partial [Taxus chinensis]